MMLTFADLSAYLNPSQLKMYRVLIFIQNFPLLEISHKFIQSQRSVKFISGFLIEFNHLLLYNLHVRNYTVMSNLLLKSIQALDDLKGSIADLYIYPIFGLSPASIIADY